MVFRGHGFEAWRQLHNHILRGCATRCVTLRDVALHPAPARDEEGVALAITRWETDLRKYVEAGGTQPGDEDKRLILLNIMPQQFREALLWRATECRSYQEFREHVRV